MTRARSVKARNLPDLEEEVMSTLPCLEWPCSNSGRLELER